MFAGLVGREEGGREEGSKERGQGVLTLLYQQRHFCYCWTGVPTHHMLPVKQVQNQALSSLLPFHSSTPRAPAGRPTTW